MSEQANVISVTAENFQSEVVERSQSLPVVLLVWAQWSDESVQMRTQLARLCDAYQGKCVLAELDAESPDSQLAQMAQGLMMQLGLQALPGLVFLSQGQPVQALSGAQADDALKAVLDELTMSPVDRIAQQVDALKAAGQLDQALLLVQQVLVEEPENHALQVVQVNLLLELGRIDEAKQILAALPDDAPGISQPKAKLAFYEQAKTIPSLVELELLLQQNPETLELHYQRSIRLLLDDRVEEALETLLSIVMRDREFRDDGARRLMLQLFDYLDAGDPLVRRFRGRLFSLLH